MSAVERRRVPGGVVETRRLANGGVRETLLEDKRPVEVRAYPRTLTPADATLLRARARERQRVARKRAAARTAAKASSAPEIMWARKVADRLRKKRLRRLPGEGRRVEEPEPFGPEWLIESIADVGRAVRKVKAGDAADKDEAAIKQYIAERAADLGVPNLIPADWKAARSCRVAVSTRRRF